MKKILMVVFSLFISFNAVHALQIRFPEYQQLRQKLNKCIDTDSDLLDNVAKSFASKNISSESVACHVKGIIESYLNTLDKRPTRPQLQVMEEIVSYFFGDAKREILCCLFDCEPYELGIYLIR